MRTSAGEKLEIIRLVEESQLPVKRVLAELDIARSTFYRWYECYQAAGEDGLVDGRPQARQHWNRIPDTIRNRSWGRIVWEIREGWEEGYNRGSEPDYSSELQSCTSTLLSYFWMACSCRDWRG